MKSDTSELVERLRTWTQYGGFVEHEEVFYGAATGHEYRSRQVTPTIVNQPKPLMEEAANLIEQQSAEIARLKQELAQRPQWAGGQSPVTCGPRPALEAKEPSQ